MITALAGGVGAAKLLIGIASVIDPQNLNVIVNTGDDIELHGLHISPDLDICTYSLAKIVNLEQGWGILGDTFACLDALRKFTGSEWFNVGDRDFATHIYRTNLLKQGFTLTAVTEKICNALNVKAKILPMTDDKFETRITTRQGKMHFEEYLVKRGAQEEVCNVELMGAEMAKPAEGVITAIENAEKIVICPSNPVVSIGTILAVKGIHEALKLTKATKIAVSPIVAGSPVKGPADKLLRGLGKEVSCFSVAQLYADFLDVFVIDNADISEKERIKQLGLEVKLADTVMRSLDDKVKLARFVLEA